MLVSRTNVRQLRRGEEAPNALSGVADDVRQQLLEKLLNDDGGEDRGIPLAGGLGRLPGEEERKVLGKAPPLSAQARTGRPGLLGDR